MNGEIRSQSDQFSFHIFCLLLNSGGFMKCKLFAFRVFYLKL